MKQITIHIPDNKFPFFMELIKNLKFIKRVDTEEVSSKEEILKGPEEQSLEISPSRLFSFIKYKTGNY